MGLIRTIAIDGPAASGKSTLAKLLAEKLNYLFFDTGLMYRAVTWIALQRDLEVDDEEVVAGLAEKLQIDVRQSTNAEDQDSIVLVDGVDITREIRFPEVDSRVSQVSAYPGVRLALTRQQRKVGKRGNVVMVGRDIGTVVLPDADMKIYLDASVEERAKRRYDERIYRGEDIEFEPVLDAMKKRDMIDSTRDIAPLRLAKDAVVVDSEGLSIEQVLVAVLDLLEQ